MWFDVFPGETLGVVGEPGCGKSTLARAMLNLIPAAAGRMVSNEQEMLGASLAIWQGLRKNVQMILPNPLASRSPRMVAGESSPSCYGVDAASIVLVRAVGIPDY